jgi:hypothetical protein
MNNDLGPYLVTGDRVRIMTKHPIKVCFHGKCGIVIPRSEYQGEHFGSVPILLDEEVAGSRYVQLHWRFLETVY